MNRQHLLHDLSPAMVPIAASSPNSVSVTAPRYKSKMKSKSKSKSTSALKMKSKFNLQLQNSQLSAHNVKFQRQQSPIKKEENTCNIKKQNKKDFHSIKSFQDLVVGKPLRSGSISSVGSMDSVSSLDSMTSLRSGISVSNATPNQLLFDDQDDMDADMYVNHADYKKGSCLDVENLLHHLTTEKGKKDFKNKLILETMYKREDVSNSVIRDVRAATPDVTKMPSQVCLCLYFCIFVYLYFCIFVFLTLSLFVCLSAYLPFV